MASIRAGMMRDWGSALSVLAIYLLVLLVPLHFARASQAELAEHGYGFSPQAWSLCIQNQVDEAPESADILASCPICQLGQTGLAMPDAAPPSMPLPGARVLAVLLPAENNGVGLVVTGAAQPRGPPAAV